MDQWRKTVLIVVLFVCGISSGEPAARQRPSLIKDDYNGSAELESYQDSLLRKFNGSALIDHHVYGQKEIPLRGNPVWMDTFTVFSATQNNDTEEVWTSTTIEPSNKSNSSALDNATSDSFDDRDNTNNNKLPWTSNRMQVNQVTYGILIGILSVADMILIWTFTYSLVYFEKRSFRILRTGRKRMSSDSTSINKSPNIPTLRPPETINAKKPDLKTTRMDEDMDTLMLDNEEMDESSVGLNHAAQNDQTDDGSNSLQKDSLLPGEKHFHVRKWNAVAMWTWEFVVDNCAICRNHIMDKCIECQSVLEQSNVDEPCTIARGKCSHVFHLHCISRWLNTRRVCPLDNRQWEFKKYGN